MGILDKNELRQRVLSYRPPAQSAPVQSAPVPRIVPSAPAQSPNVGVKRKREQKVKKAEQRFNKKQIKKRPGKPASAKAKIRKLVRDPTRQRFFEQCRSRSSVLWQPTAAGTEQMVKLLFDRACLDPIDMVYRLHPSQTHGVEHGVIKREVHWQVYKDRSNWLGKTPTRDLAFGAPMPFDWEAELQVVRNMQPEKKKRKNIKTEPPTPAIKTEDPEPEPEQVPKHVVTGFTKEQATSYDVDKIKACVTKCGLAVWIGDVDKNPVGMLIAEPRGSDWTTVNAEPYCPTCWDKENELMDGMAGDYKAVGDKTAETKAKEAAAKKAEAAAKREAAKAAKAAKAAQAAKAARKGPTKKTLGGVQGPMPTSTVDTAAAGPGFQKGDSVNAKFSNNRYYGAFVCKVNEDGTYNLYFPEEWQKKPLLFNVPAKFVKAPLQCSHSKRYKSWHNYVGKTFVDPGTKDDPEGAPDFEGGEFVIAAVVDGQLFECTRAFQPDCVEEFDIGYTLPLIRKYEEE